MAEQLPRYLSTMRAPELRQSHQILHPLNASEASNNPTHIQLLMPATTIGKSKTTETDGTMKKNLNGICTSAKNTTIFLHLKKPTHVTITENCKNSPAQITMPEPPQFRTTSRPLFKSDKKGIAPRAILRKMYKII
ncbi:hypothetical protein [Pseudomonas sp. BNK-15]|uniref:hypothetical protein n=1 Tax=Pseudomonas sp. BNK-15 TaxID=3376152 RepID=UPI0039BF7B17